MAAKRLTRKEIVRQDRIQQTLTETSSWLVRNLSYILALVAVVLVTLAATYLWQVYQSSVRTELQTRFSDALAIYHAPLVQEEAVEAAAEGDQPENPKYEFESARERSENALASFQELAEDYSGMRLGLLSQYYVGLTLIDLERLEEARSQLQSLIANSEFADLKNLARHALVQVAISNENYEEAIHLSNAILGEPSPNFPQQMVLARLAQSYEAAGKAEEALRSYRRITAEFPGTSFAAEAEKRVTYLELRGVTIEETEPTQEGQSASAAGEE